MEEKNWIRALDTLSMPEEMKAELMKKCLEEKPARKLYLRCPGLVSACVGIILFMSVCCPAYAAFQLYQTKNMDVFFEPDVTQEQIDTTGEILEQTEGIKSVRFISAEEAWETFSAEYLTPEAAAEFTENPLAESFSYRIVVELDADTEAIREKIQELDGVRKVSNLREQRAEEQEKEKP